VAFGAFPRGRLAVVVISNQVMQNGDGKSFASCLACVIAQAFNADARIKNIGAAMLA
jgi:hypothetical protein